MTIEIAALLGLTSLIALCVGGPAAAATEDELRAALQSPAIEGLYARTYKSVVDRVEPDGYFEESLTGAYAGMFPRTVGGLTSLFIETGRIELARRTVDAVLQNIEANGMTRAPHVMGRRTVIASPVPGSETLLSTPHPTPLYRLDSGYAGAVRFAAPADPPRAAEAFIAVGARGAVLRCSIAETVDASDAVAFAETRVGSTHTGDQWVRFRFKSPVALTPGHSYVLRIQTDGAEPCSWWGEANGGGNPLAGGYGRVPNPVRWIDNPSHVPAYAIDTGALKHTRRTLFPLIDRYDQADGNFHVLASWARLALLEPRTAWEDRTYRTVAMLTDTASDWPYVAPRAPHSAPGLVRNVCLEHSREGRYWDCWDLLTQSWACQALRMLSRVAERRGDADHAVRWRKVYTAVEASVRERLTMQVDGKLVYAEMRLPDGGEGRLFDGLSWVNLAPVAAQWEGADPAILRDTIAAYRSKAALVATGLAVTGTEWQPGHPVSPQVIGKGVGWDLAYAAQTKDWAGACNWLAFLAAANTAPIYTEAFNVARDGSVTLQDAGNGEQVSWWCWGVARLRKAVGLPAAP